MTLFDFLSLENYVNVPSNSNKQKKCLNKNCFLLASWRSMTKKAGSGSISQRHGFADPDPLVRGMDPRIRIHSKMSWLRNTEIIYLYVMSIICPGSWVAGWWSYRVAWAARWESSWTKTRAGAGPPFASSTPVNFCTSHTRIYVILLAQARTIWTENQGTGKKQIFIHPPPVPVFASLDLVRSFRHLPLIF